MGGLGTRIYGLAAVVMGVAGLWWGDFAVDWVPVPATLPGRLAVAYAVGAVLVIGGMLINWPRTTARGAALLAVLFTVGLVLLDLTHAAMHPLQFLSWSSSAEQLAVAAGGLVAYASSAKIEPLLSSRLARAGRIAFGLCLFSFGAAHFVYLQFTAPLVPKWLPPSQVFWAYATGVAQIAGGFGILSGVLALWAARLLGLMYVVFGILVHAPLLASAPANHGYWIENALNLALIGVAWIVADSLTKERA